MGSHILNVPVGLKESVFTNVHVGVVELLSQFIVAENLQ